MTWRLVVTPKVEAALRTFPPQTKRYIRGALEDIRRDPSIGKLLRDELAGLYSFRARRFRIVYRIERQVITVVVVGVGPRKTIYEELIAEIHPKE
ncbi:MAG: type II toxin-antitoxin system RelE/ParE family toxin [Candidatus Omnitrophica bacterium]|nr:type II toxin-antitoxin system RelE/ParE family toxin [Candidatus Omnitrophota bacterium]